MFSAVATASGRRRSVVLLSWNEDIQASIGQGANPPCDAVRGFALQLAEECLLASALSLNSWHS
jgi:hypothetical protein